MPSSSFTALIQHAHSSRLPRSTPFPSRSPRPLRAQRHSQGQSLARALVSQAPLFRINLRLYPPSRRALTGSKRARF
eukprot:2762991-Pleurochrysis_carterae.AAC.1